jgi:Skp family chaperone for outer membrane proteins
MAQEGAARPVSSTPKTAAAPPNGTNVAVIDVAYIFKNLNQFNAAMKEFDSEAQSLQAWAQDREKTLQTMQEGLKDLKATSPDFQKREEKLANEATTYKLEVRRRQQEMAQKEAAIYYDSYAELEKTVALFAQRNRIGIVLKYQREPMKREDRRSVMEGLARPVVYQSQLDITNFILTELNKGQPPIAPNTKSTGPVERTSSPTKSNGTKTR